jgi:hypothetical protein
MIPTINTNSTLSSALLLWQSTPSTIEQRNSPAASTTAAQPSVDPRNSAQSSIDQVFAILKAASNQSSGLASNETVTSAYSAQTVSAGSLTVETTNSVSIAMPTGLAQINDAVAQVNAQLKAGLGSTAGTVSDFDAIAVSLGGAPVSGDLGLPQGAKQPTDFMQAIQLLAKSSNAGVAAAAASLGSRVTQVQSEGWGVNAQSIGYTGLSRSGSNDTTAPGMISDLMTTWRDTMTYAIAENLVNSPKQDVSAQTRFLGATYNGAFTLVDTTNANEAGLTRADQLASTNIYNFTVGGGEGDKTWAMVLPDQTVTVTSSITVKDTSTTN